MIKKSNFVKEDKTIVQSTYPPLETVPVDCKGTEVKASHFKIAGDKTPIFGIIEKNNFAKYSLHIIGQQLNHIEEKIIKKTASLKPEKPLIDLPNQWEKLSLKTSQAKTLEKIEKMLFDLNNLKVKIGQGTSTSATQAISKEEKDTDFEENTESDSLSSVSQKNYFWWITKN